MKRKVCFRKMGAAVAVAFVIISCTSKIEEVQNISVDTSENFGNAIDGNVKIKAVVQLHDSLLVGDVSKVLYSGGKIYIWDKSAASILCCTTDGDLQFRISAKGRGPGEYTGISNFYLSGSGNTVNVIAQEKKLLEFSAVSGELVSESGIDVKSIMCTDGIELQDGKTVLGIIGPEHNVAVDGADTLKYHIPFNMTRDFAFMERAFSQDGPKALFVHGMDNCIYSVAYDTSTVRYIVDFKGMEISNDDYQTKTPAEIQKIYDERSVATRIDNLVNSRNWLSFSYWMMNPDKTQQTNYVLYNKRNGKAMNILGSPLFPIKDANDNLLVSVADNSDSRYAPYNGNPVVVLWEM